MSQHKGACSRGGPGAVSPPGMAAVSKHETGIPPGTAAVSKHETKSVIQHQRACSRGSGGGFPFGTAAVSKHETGTVTKQTTGALQFMVAFALRRGGATPPRIYLTSLCPGRREVRPGTSTPLTYTIISSACRAGLS